MVTLTHFHPGKIERDTTDWLIVLIIIDNLRMTGRYGALGLS